MPQITKTICNDLKDLDIEELVLKGTVKKNINEMGKNFKN